MMILLPKEDHSLSTLITDLTEESYYDLLDDMKQENVDIFLPSFNVSTPQYKLSDMLKNLGIQCIMKLKLVYPKWPKLKNQPEFNLPPHGPVCFAAALPDDVEVSFCDENVSDLDFEQDADLVAISCMLTCQMPRGWEIADLYREMGKPVIFGGIGTMLHAEETQKHADSVFMGEAEGRMEEVIRDAENGTLKPRYDFFHAWPDLQEVGPARRDILERDKYRFRNVQMVDLVHASRGCRFNCFPCCTPYLGGRKFRPRPIDKVVEEVAGIDNNRLFFVDNSLAQD
ncbi:MAG: cobalamin-dependent protein, partial [Pirellulaceae bacterium]